jgi:aldehyde:ferredoxin oxidoreductase
MLGGYIGKILRIDLTEERISTQTFSEETLRKYIGGSGLGAKILFDETSEKTDPLGPENLLIFMTGPLVGTKAPNFGRYQVVTKSPLTGAYGEGNSGGTWGTTLKKAGYDGVVVKGKANRPVYIWINNGEVEIRDASHLWGKDTYEMDGILKRAGPEDISMRYRTGRGKPGKDCSCYE